jgi:hypothetical protein
MGRLVGMWARENANSFAKARNERLIPRTWRVIMGLLTTEGKALESRKMASRARKKGESYAAYRKALRIEDMKFKRWMRSRYVYVGQPDMSAVRMWNGVYQPYPGGIRRDSGLNARVPRSGRNSHATK